jgi:hypothetical protein
VTRGVRRVIRTSPRSHRGGTGRWTVARRLARSDFAPSRERRRDRATCQETVVRRDAPTSFSNDLQGCTVRGHAFTRLVSAECSSGSTSARKTRRRIDRLATARARGDAALTAGKKVRAKDPRFHREGKPSRAQSMNEGTGKRRSALDGAGQSSKLPADPTEAGKPVRYPTFDDFVANASPEGSRSARTRSWESAVQREPIFRRGLAPGGGRRDAVWVYVSPSFAGIVVRHLLCRRRVGKVAGIRRGSPRMRRNQARCTRQGCWRM